MTQIKNQERSREEIVVKGKPTLVLGASLKPERTSFTAINMLGDYGHTVYALGLRAGIVDGVEIETDPETIQTPELHTITLYLNAKRQVQYYDFILSRHPKRIIFNPGAENEELYLRAREARIEVVVACTLVMLNFGQY